ncbi:LLM class flavin-dependent oxidoreductase [Amycolatopsis sp. Poz14]|uniref:LLM class flavin-dependent oxidoreductase n=1 Tax=Amycolatopsis sp. Poz14 TaxID=1447705 RepID=UPI001EE93189|nr:LLM class flavin-dependent oxidoreductase [Amycolatopsis sp. Poz14]MCG3754081.1 LLM class flavin-dependent oxidoreductase [Amycolatopsis sp. Poz14]
MPNRPPGARRGVPAELLRGPFDPGGQPELHRDKHMHLSLFAWNVSNGLSASKAVLSDPERHQEFWKWPSAAKLLRATEEAGFDSQLQYGMWSGYEGATRWNNSHLDFATAATGSAAITERLGIYTTVHVGYQIPPMLLAKMTASMDHLSGGRLGVNIVAGQNSVDYAQFGLVGPPSQQVRYAIADELVTALKYLWSSEEPVDFEGEYFQFYGAQIDPLPTSRPRPLLICAAGSDIGLDFATRQCDALFITADDKDLDGYARRAAKIHAMAAEHGRKVRICAMCYVVMDETDAKAAETTEWMREQIDRDALEVWLTRSGHIMNSERQEVTEDQFGEGRAKSGANQDPYLGIGKEHYESLGMGMGAYQLFGSYETVADQLIDLYESGVEQVALCFFDPHKGVQQIRDHVLPLLRKRGYNLPV